jgi:hypothetical protein
MLQIGQLNFLHCISRECNLYSRVYQQMRKVVGVRRAIYFRLNISKYYKLSGYDLIFLAIVMIELQNPRLQNKRKDDYLFELKRIFNSLSDKDRSAVSNYYTTLIYGRK